MPAVSGSPSMLSTATRGTLRALVGQPLALPAPLRSIQSLATRLSDPKDGFDPWPYREKSYTKWHSRYEGTYKRMTANSKIIVVDGNVGSGKSTMAAGIAEQLGFYHIPEFSVDMILTNSYGNDMRDHYDKIPKELWIPDINMYYKDPHTANLTQYHYHMFFGRHEQWMNAVAHLLNTGQGVVIERSIWSDFVFMNAMRAKEYISPQLFRHYHWFRNIVMKYAHFMPHIVIYLNTPVKQCLANIKARGIEAEITTPVLDELYLSTIEESYKDMLMEMKDHCKMLIYDWDRTVVDGVDRVIEDIEGLDLEFFDRHSVTHNRSWFRPGDDFEWCLRRQQFTQKTQLSMIWGKYGSAYYDVPEMFVGLPKKEKLHAVMRKHMNTDGYAFGWHPKDFAKYWRGQLCTLKMYHSDPINNWYEHYYKDTWYQENLQTTPDESMDWGGDRYMH